MEYEEPNQSIESQESVAPLPYTPSSPAADAAPIATDGATTDVASNGLGGVEFCERPADIPVIGAGGLEIPHWWLRTPNAEAGMGPNNGSVPGEHRSADYPGMPTTMNDHTGEGLRDGSTCVPVEERTGYDVEQECIERELAIGGETGRWAPPFNDCHSEVIDIMERCRVDRDDLTSEGGASQGAGDFTEAGQGGAGPGY